MFAGTRVVTIKREPLSPNSGDDVNVVDDDSNGFASGPTTIVTRFVYGQKKSIDPFIVLHSSDRPPCAHLLGTTKRWLLNDVTMKKLRHVVAPVTRGSSRA